MRRRGEARRRTGQEAERKRGMAKEGKSASELMRYTARPNQEKRKTEESRQKGRKNMSGLSRW